MVIQNNLLPGRTPRPRQLPEKSETYRGRSRHDHHGSSEQARVVDRYDDNDAEAGKVTRVDYFGLRLGFLFFCFVVLQRVFQSLCVTSGRWITSGLTITSGLKSLPV